MKPLISNISTDVKLYNNSGSSILERGRNKRDRERGRLYLNYKVDQREREKRGKGERICLISQKAKEPCAHPRWEI